jgi:putative membrane protein
MMMWYNGGHAGWDAWLLGSAVMVVFWALVIIAIVLLARYLLSSRSESDSAARSKTAENLLAERYARGDIDDEEYLRRKAILRQSN